MIPALRLTIMLICAPASLAAQGPPVPPRPPTPRVAPEPSVTPRPERPPRPPRELRELRDWAPALTPMPELWHEPKFELRDFHVDVPEMRFEMPMPPIEAPAMSFHTEKFEAQMEHLEAKRFELDRRMEEMSLRGVDRWTPRAEVSRSEPFATRPRAAWLQGDAADSLYKASYELLNRGEWRRAAAGFAAIPQRFPNSGYASDALYWQAFALYRIGGTEDLRSALRSLETMRSKYPQAKTQADAAALATRIQGALASRGDRGAEAAIRETASEQGQPTCDREDMAVRAEALKALLQTDPGSVGPIVRRVLARKDACSAPLRRQAVYVLGQGNDQDAPTTLRDVALNDPESEVRNAAIQHLARSPSDIAVNTLDELLRTSTDQSVQRTAARALASNPSPRAKQAVRGLIERADAPERLRIEAVGAFENPERATEDDATYLRNIYTKIDNPRVKARIARVIGHLGGDTNDAWLLGLMRNNDEPLEVRTAALSRIASRNMGIADAVRLYGNVADREMRQQLINIYGQRREPEATDKLIDIAKNDTDYNLRRQAINALTRKNDPRATKLLLEIIDK